jgi:DNA processing protein
MDFQKVQKNHFPTLFPTLDPESYPSILEFEGSSEHLYSKCPKVAIVGTRNITPYGRKIINEVLPDLANMGFIIVSGGAFGVDIESQKTASHFTNRLITVLGSGLHHKAPKTNKPYFQKFIQKGGCLVSPFTSNTHPNKYTFVQRNQIIASLADIVILIEAGQKSGSIHTANYASEQGIPVACFPGDKYSSLTKGTHSLVQKGAHLVLNTTDIVDLIPNHRLKHLQKPKPSNTQNTLKPNIYNQLHSMLN